MGERSLEVKQTAREADHFLTALRLKRVELCDRFSVCFHASTVTSAPYACLFTC